MDAQQTRQHSIFQTFFLNGVNFSPAGSQTFHVSIFDQPLFRDISIVFLDLFSVAKTETSQLKSVPEFVSIEIGSSSVQAGQNGFVPIYFQSPAAVTNLILFIQLSPDVLQNLNLSLIDQSLKSADLIHLEDTRWRLNFSFKEGAIFQESTQLANLNFSTRADQNSIMVSIFVTDIIAEKADGKIIQPAFATTGKVLLVGTNPFLEASILPDRRRQLTIYGKPGFTYQVQSASKITIPMKWNPVGEITLNGINGVFQLPAEPGDVVFYRVVEIAK